MSIKTLDLSKRTNEENSSWEKITKNKKLIKDVTDDHFYTKVPFQKLNIKYDMSEAVWKNENTILVKIDTNRNYTVVDNQKEITISGLDLFKYYDDAAKNFKNKNNGSNNFKQDNLYYGSIAEDLELQNDCCLINNNMNQ